MERKTFREAATSRTRVYIKSETVKTHGRNTTTVRYFDDGIAGVVYFQLINIIEREITGRVPAKYGRTYVSKIKFRK